MQIKDVDSTTEDAFLRCLHLEEPPEPEVMALRRRWYDRYKNDGLRAKVLVDENNTVLAMGQYVPVEISPFIGEGLAVILCMWVHGYDHHVGNVQGRGYGKQLLGAMETEIAESAFTGIAAWGMDFPYWNPVSWYLSRGYEKADTRGQEILVWKPLSDEAVAPKFVPRPKTIATSSDKPTIAVYLNAWCTGGCTYAHQARCAAKELGDQVEYTEFNIDDKADILKRNIDYGVYLNGESYRDFEEPWTTEVLVADVKKTKQGK